MHRRTKCPFRRPKFSMTIRNSHRQCFFSAARLASTDFVKFRGCFVFWLFNGRTHAVGSPDLFFGWVFFVGRPFGALPLPLTLNARRDLCVLLTPMCLPDFRPFAAEKLISFVKEYIALVNIPGVDLSKVPRFFVKWMTDTHTNLGYVHLSRIPTYHLFR